MRENGKEIPAHKTILSLKYFNLKDFINSGFIQKKPAILFILRNRIGEYVSYKHIKYNSGLENKIYSNLTDNIKLIKEENLLLDNEKNGYKLTSKGFWITTFILYNFLNIKLKIALRKNSFSEFIYGFGFLEKTHFPKKKIKSEYNWPNKTKLLLFLWNYPIVAFSVNELRIKINLGYDPYTEVKELRYNGLIETLNDGLPIKLIEVRKKEKYRISYIGLIFINQLLKKCLTELERNFLFEDDTKPLRLTNTL